MRTHGSGQTSGLPLSVTATALADAQTLHTAPVGTATPHRIRLMALNSDRSVDHTLHFEIYNVGAALVSSFDVLVPMGADLVDCLKGGELVLNGTAVLKVWADASEKIAVVAVVDNQADVAGIASQILASGLIAAVQNAPRYGIGTGVGGVGTATIGAAEIAMPRAGTLKNLRAVASAAIGGGASCVVSVFKNGVATALSLTLDNASGTTAATDTDSVAVVAGDLITFGVVTDNAGAPAANIQASCLLE